MFILRSSLSSTFVRNLANNLLMIYVIIHTNLNLGPTFLKTKSALFLSGQFIDPRLVKLIFLSSSCISIKLRNPSIKKNKFDIWLNDKKERDWTGKELDFRTKADYILRSSALGPTAHGRRFSLSAVRVLWTVTCR